MKTSSKSVGFTVCRGTRAGWVGVMILCATALCSALQAQEAPTYERIIAILMQQPPVVPPGWGIVGNGSWLGSGRTYVDPLGKIANASDHDMRLVVPNSPPYNTWTEAQYIRATQNIQNEIKLRIGREFGQNANKILEKTSLYPPEQLIAGRSEREVIALVREKNIVPNLSGKEVEGVFKQGRYGFLRGQETKNGAIFYNDPGVKSAGGKMKRAMADIISDKLAGETDRPAIELGHASQMQSTFAAKTMDMFHEGKGRELVKQLSRTEGALRKMQGLSGLDRNATSKTFQQLMDALNQDNNIVFKDPAMRQLLNSYMAESKLKATLLENLQKATSVKDKELIRSMLSDINVGGQSSYKLVQALKKMPLDKIGAFVGTTLQVVAVYHIYSQFSEGEYYGAGRSAVTMGTFKIGGIGPGLFLMAALQVSDQGIAIGQELYGHFLKSMTLQKDSMDLLDGFDDLPKWASIDDLARDIRDPRELAEMIRQRAVRATDRGIGPKTSAWSDRQLAPVLAERALEEIGMQWALKRYEWAQAFMERYAALEAEPLLLDIRPHPAYFRAGDPVKKVNIQLQTPNYQTIDFLDSASWRKDLDALAGPHTYEFYIDLDWYINGQHISRDMIGRGLSFDVEKSDTYEIMARVRVNPYFYSAMGAAFLPELTPIDRSVKVSLEVIVGEEPELAIIPPPPVAFGDALPGEPYVFVAAPLHIPTEALYSWKVNGEDSPGGQNAVVIFPANGLYTVEVDARWRDARGRREIRSRIEVRIGEDPALEIIPPPDALAGIAQPNIPYVFVVQPIQIPSHATYTWHVNGVLHGTGESLLMDFPQDGDYQLQVTAMWGDPEQDGGPQETLQASYVVRIGLPRPYDGPEVEPWEPEDEDEDQDLRDFELVECEKWAVARSGGVGVTIDTWDISKLPVGARFNMRYNAQSVPDKFIVTYAGAEVLDTGWRGDPSYVTKSPSLYPGGLSGPGAGSANRLFVKGAADSFTVTVNGPESGTAWEYSFLARCKEGDDDEEEDKDKEDPETTFALSPLTPPVVYGSSVSLKVTGATDKAQSYIWQASPGLTFAPHTTKSPSTTVTFSRVGKVSLWVQVIVPDEDGVEQVLETEVVEIDVVPPRFWFAFDPPEGQARPGDSVRVEILSAPSLNEDLVEYRWMAPVPGTFMSHTPHGSKIGIQAGPREQQIALHVLARVPFHGDSLAEIQGSFKLGDYKVFIGEPVHRGPPPQIWDEAAGGLVDAPRGTIITHQQVSLEASVTPAPEREVRYSWSVQPAGGRAHGTTGSTQTFSAHEAGTYQVTVEARMDDGTVLGSNTRAVTVIEPPIPPKATIKLAVREHKVRAGQSVTVVHSEIKNASRHAWIGFYEKSSDPSTDYLSYTFLGGLANRTYDVIAPAKRGHEYHFRLFLTEGYDEAARSECVEVQ